MTAATAGLLVLLAGCGDGGETAPSGATATTDRPTSTTSAASSGLELQLTLAGSYERPVKHVVRVEHSTGKQVFERTLGPDLRLSESLEPGEYRMLSFQRMCRSASCGTSPAPDELGEPLDLCGTQFTVAPATPVKASVKLTANEGCEFTLA